MDSGQFRRRFVWRLLGSPWVSVPLGMGAASLGAAVAMGDPASYLGFVGVTGMLFGVAAAATRWIWQFDEISQATFDDLKSETEQTQIEHLTALERRLRADRDPRTNRYAEDLQKLYRRLEKAGVMGSEIDAELLPDIREKCERLFRSCVSTLESTLDYFTAAQEMATDEARRQMLNAREELLEEVGRSVHHLGATVDHLQTSSLRRDRTGDDLARTREELEMGLQVAQRVEQRLSQFDADLRAPQRAAE